MIRFPNRADRVADDVLLFATARPACEHVPDASAEIGTAEDCVERDRDERNGRDAELRAHVRACAIAPAGGSIFSAVRMRSKSHARVIASKR